MLTRLPLAKKLRLQPTRLAMPCSVMPGYFRNFFAAPTYPLMNDDLPYHLVVGLPALSPTMSIGALAEWYVGEGDKFIAGDAIAKIETDKASIDFEAQDDGYVAKLLMEAGTGADVAVGTPILITVEEGDDVEAFKDYVVQEAISEASPAKKTPVITDPPAASAPASPPIPAPTTAPSLAASPPSVPTKPSASSSPPSKDSVITKAPTSSDSNIASTPIVSWGSRVNTSSPIAKTLARKQHAYIDLYGSTGQRPIL